ncbi:hypothetical protein ACFQMJ_30655 [Cohnella cellulosilytica]|uniref:ABC transporter permease n=2 Tax=Cohnella cellulosilytica TaxID=986710 RepID=A0ABW2FPN1_9BACL
MIGMMRYAFRDYARSYRYVGPLLAFAIFLVFIYGVVPNPVMPSYSLTVSLTFLTAAWLGFGFVDAEDETQQLVGVLHSGGWMAYHVGRWLLMAGACGLLTLVATFYPIVLEKFDRQPGVGEILAGLAGHMGLALLGVGISYLFTCKLIGKLNYAIIGLVLALSLSFAAGGIRDSLPESAGFVVHLLPPVFSLIDVFNRYETVSTAEAAFALLAPPIYSLILGVVYLRLMKIRRL